MKKFLKITGFCLLGILGVIVLAVVIFAISGGFTKKPVPVTSLQVQVNGEIKNEVLVNDDFTTLLTYTPATATALTMDVTVHSGDKNVLANIPKTVEAGTPFTIKVAKDEQGNNIGGEVELMFTNTNKLVRTSLKIMVDVALPDGALGFTTEIPFSNNVYKISVSPSTYSTMILSSNISKSVNPTTGLVFGGFVSDELRTLANKKAYYHIVDSHGYETIKLNESIKDVTLGNGQKAYQIDLSAINASTQTILTVYVPRTYALQKAFNENWFKAIIEGGEFEQLSEYNAFLNEYIDYFTATEEAQLFFEGQKKPIVNIVDGVEVTTQQISIDLDFEALNQSLKYVFVNATATFIVSDVQIGKIESLNSVFMDVLQTKKITTTNIASEFGVNIVSVNDSAMENELLLNSIKDLNIGTYIKYAGTLETDAEGRSVPEGVDFEYDDFGNLIAPVVKTGEDNRLKYVPITTGEGDDVETIWYIYSDKYATITKNVQLGTTTWDLETFYPNYANDIVVNGLPKVYLIYYIDNVGLNAEDQAVVSYKFGLSELQVKYNPVQINFSNTDTRKIILVNENTLSDAWLINQNSGYSLNSTQVSKTDIYTTGGELAHYKKIMWFVAYESNKVDGENILKVVDPSTGQLTTYSNSIHLAGIDGKLFSVELGDTTYNTWCYLGEGDSVDLQGFNANAYFSNINSASGAKLFAMVMATDKNGNVLHRTTQITGGEGTTNVDAWVVSQCVSTPININVTYQLTSEDTLHIYTYDVETATFVKYEQLVDGTQTVLNYIHGQPFELFVSTYDLTDVDGEGNLRQKTINLQAGLVNYFKNFQYAPSSYWRTGVGVDSLIFATVEKEDNSDYMAITFNTQTVSNGSFDLYINKNINNSDLEPIGTTTTYQIVRLQVNEATNGEENI